MNDRLKFRVWDIKNKQMINSPEFISFDYDCNLLRVRDRTISINEIFNLNFNEVIIEQCTGLKDKNGKLAFEGDIIIPVYVNPLGGYNENDFDLTNKKIVAFKNGCFGFETKTSFYTIDNYIPREDGEYICNHGNKLIYSDFALIKVVGNIHENPELIGGK